MHAAMQVVEQDGLIVAAARCNDGFPSHGNFKRLLFDSPTPRALLDTVMAPGFSVYDQWEAQLLAIIALKARVALKSDLDPAEVRRAHLEPVEDIGARVSTELTRRGDVPDRGPARRPHEHPLPGGRVSEGRPPLARATIERMVGYVPGEQPGPGEKVIKLNTNENPFPPSPRVMEAIREVDAEWLRRYPNPTADAFPGDRRPGPRRPPDMIIAGNGSDEILTIALRTFVGPGDLIAWPDPTYSLYPVLAQIGEARALTVPWEEGWRLAGAGCWPRAEPGPSSSPTRTLPRARSYRPRRSPSYPVRPTAWCWSTRPTSISPIPTACPCSPTVPTSSSAARLSKGYSLAGLRFGYALAAPGLVTQMMKVKDSYNCDALAIAAAQAALLDQAHARAGWEAVRTERARLTAELERRGWRVIPSQANFLLAAVPDGDGGAVYRALKQKGILVRYFDSPDLSRMVRITIGRRDENDALLQALAAP